MTDLVSVIIPIYNVEKYIIKCIESVINQTYDNLEIILVDDGSTDSCQSICDSYKIKDSRVKVIHKKNGGLSSARNAGLDECTGDYVVFIDSDDFIKNDFIYKLYSSVCDGKFDIVISSFLLIDEDGATKFPDSYPLKEEIITSKSALERLHYGGAPYVVAWNKIYKTNLFKNLRYPLGKIGEDGFIIHYLYAKCQLIHIIEYTGYYYLQRKNSISSDEISAKNIDYLDALLDRYYFYINNKNNNLISNLILKIVNTFFYLAIRLKFKNSDEKMEWKKRKKIVKRIYSNSHYCSFKLWLMLYFPYIANIFIHTLGKK